MNSEKVETKGGGTNPVDHRLEQAVEAMNRTIEKVGALVDAVDALLAHLKELYGPGYEMHLSGADVATFGGGGAGGIGDKMPPGAVRVVANGLLVVGKGVMSEEVVAGDICKYDKNDNSVYKAGHMPKAGEEVYVALENLKKEWGVELLENYSGKRFVREVMSGDD